MTYAAVPQMHQTGKKSPTEAGPRAFAEGGSLDFRNGTISSAGAGSKKIPRSHETLLESPGTPRDFLLCWRYSGRGGLRGTLCARAALPQYGGDMETGV